MDNGQETFLRVGIDGTASLDGARIVKRSLDDIDNRVNQSAQTWKEYSAANMSAYMKMTGSHGEAMKAMGADWQKYKEQAGIATNQTVKGLDNVSKSAKSALITIQDLEAMFARLIFRTAAIGAIYGTINLIKSAFQETLKYLGQIETSQLGIASSFLTGGKYINETTNKALEGQRALKAAQMDSKEVIEQLKAANFQTIATLDQLIVAYQTTLPVAMAKGFNKKQVMDFTLAMVQAAGAIGLPFDQMAEETRSLLTGAINPRNSRIATVLGLRPDDIAAHKHNADELFKFLMSRLEGFRIAGIASQTTWLGLWSNMKDIAKQGAGFALEGIFEGVKSVLIDIQNSIVTIDNDTKKITWNEDFIKGAKEIGEFTKSIFDGIVSATKALIEHKDSLEAILALYAVLQTSKLVQNMGSKAIGGVTDSSGIVIKNQLAETSYKEAAATTAQMQAEIAENEATRTGIALDIEQQSVLVKLMAMQTEQLGIEALMADSKARSLSLRIEEQQQALIAVSAFRQEEIAKLESFGLEEVALQQQNVLKGEQAEITAKINQLTQMEATAQIEAAEAHKIASIATMKHSEATILLTQQEERLVGMNTLLSKSTKELTAAQEVERLAAIELSKANAINVLGHSALVTSITGLEKAFQAMGGWFTVAIASVWLLYEAYKELNEMEEKYAADKKVRDADTPVGKIQARIDEVKKQIKELSQTPQERAKETLSDAEKEVKLAQDKLSVLKEQKKYNARPGDPTSEEDVGFLNKGRWIEIQKENDEIKRQEDVVSNLIPKTKELVGLEKELAKLKKYKQNAPKPEDDKWIAKIDAAYKSFIDSQYAANKAMNDLSAHESRVAVEKRLNDLELEKEQYLISFQDYYDKRYQIQKQGIDDEIELAKKSVQESKDNWDEMYLQAAAYTKGVYVNKNGGLSVNQTGDEQEKKAWDALKRVEEERKKYYEANKVVTDLEKKDQEALLKLKIEQFKWMEKQRDVALETIKIESETRVKDASFKASQIGVSAATGAITDPYANAIAVEKARHDTVMNNFENEARALNLAFERNINNETEIANIKAKQLDLIRQINEEQIKNSQNIGNENLKQQAEGYSEIAKAAQTTYPKITALQTATHLITKEYAKEEVTDAKTGLKTHELTTKGKQQMTADYTSLAGEMFSNLASTMDTTNREGFESAKALNIAAAIMATAAGIMRAYSDLGPIAGSIAAVAIGALGAIQIATIASTSFGGGASSPTVSAGSFAGGAAGNGGSVGGSIGAPVNSIHDSLTQSQLQEIAKNTKNTSLAIGKVADGLTKISDLFSSGSFLNMAVGTLPTEKGYEPHSVISQMWTASMKDFKNQLTGGYLLDTMKVNWNDIGGTLANQMIASMNFVIPGFSAILGGALGGSKTIEGSGISLGMKGGSASASNYIRIRTDGGWFGDDSHTNQYINNPNFQNTMQSTINSIVSTINRASVSMGTTSDISKANVASVDISTAGRKAEDIQKDVEAWLNTASDELAKTVDGLKDFAFYGENAFDALIRLSTALQSANEKFELIGAKLITSSLSGANAAYKLEEMMGGADKFASKVDKYFSTMFTDEQQQAMKAAQATRQVNVAFAEMGISVPNTKAEFVNLVNSLDLTTDSGSKLFAGLMDVSEAFGITQDAVEKMQTSLNKTATTAIDTALNAANALKDINSGSLSIQSPESLYFERQATFAAALANGRKDEIPQLGKDLLESSKAYNASGSGYVTDFNNVSKALADIAGLKGSPTLEAAERQVQLLTDIKKGFEDGTYAVVATASSGLVTGSSVSNAVNTATQNAGVYDYTADYAIALKMATGMIAQDLKYDLNKSGTVDIQDAMGYLKMSRGLPAFASGTSYVPYDMTANIHQGEIILDRQTSDMLRRYGITADNSESIAELKAIVRVLQAGFTKLVDQGEENNRNSKETAANSRLAAAA